MASQNKGKSARNKKPSSRAKHALPDDYRQALISVLVQRYVAAADRLRAAQAEFFAARNDILYLHDADER